ncbi:hypothetical protein EGM88_10960 [Aureibaculum marinum]|uniref:DUF6265 domain-containing protein n=1 Tax=Aureibaculum marinum TaxID=2487930 RepID=A0A3N4NUX1_9FLAO|nr:DUF6265 family protein [Aureibaculum marinum]RPD95980.1 hypothetical protein EGM88_10960 [Aureibaculum marinum]
MNKIVLLFSILILFNSCKNKEFKSEEVLTKTNKKSYSQIKQLQWLVGKWTNITEEQQSYETWTKVNDSILTAYSYTTVLKDTVFQEYMTIQQDLDKVVLIVSGPKESNQKPVIFDLNLQKKDTFTFVNELHDFPNKISYTNPVKDSIHAWIEGKIDSEYKKIDFYFKRSNK